MKKLVHISLALAISFTANATAQTLTKYAPPGALVAVEINDLAGARKTASAFVSQVEQLKVVDTIIEAMDVSSAERRQAQTTLNDLSSLIDREGLVAVYLDAKKLEPQVLLAARPAPGADAKVKKWLQDSLDNARKGKIKVLTAKAGGFPVYTLQTGEMPMSIGYQGGIAYAATNLGTLSGFLKRVGGSAEPGLASSSLYKNAMDGAGTGVLRIYADLGSLAGLARVAAKEFGNELPKVQLEPIFKAFTTLGRLGASWKLATDGLESTTLFAPDARGGDQALYDLLTARQTVTLKAASIVPANVTTFSTSAGNADGWYGYVSDLVDRTKLNPGGLDPLLRRELGMDFRKVALSWMTGEFAAATFTTNSTPNASNATSVLGSSVVYISTNDEAAAKASLEAILPRLVEQGNRLANQKLLDYRPSRAKIAGVEVSRFPIAQGVSFVAATRNGFLLLATSDDAMIAALGGGPRLADDAAFKTAFARVPTTATGFTYSDLPRNLRDSADALSQQLEAGIALGLDIKPSAAKKLTTSIQKLFAFTAERAGPTIGWTEVGSNGVRSKNFTPIKW